MPSRIFAHWYARARYYEQVLKSGLPEVAPRYRLRGVRLITIPDFGTPCFVRVHVSVLDYLRVCVCALVTSACLLD